tara:strand:+ start:322 stop:651 length:330 start_codon:yes stop_codon:yes gene_type:complete
MPYVNQRKTLDQMVAIVDLIGIENTVALYELLNGRQTYFPSVKTVAEIINNRKLVEDFKDERFNKYRKHNAKQLLKKYGMSLNTFDAKLRRYRRKVMKYQKEGYKVVLV